MTQQTFQNVTIYRTGEFIGNVHRTDCREVTVETVEYAQYTSALQVTYLEKGKRNKRRFVLTYKPFFVIVPTAQAIEPDGMMKPNGDGSSISRYSSFDDGWIRDFDEKLKAAGVPILADFRTHNTSDRFAEVR